MESRENSEVIIERYDLSMSRISQMLTENTIKGPYADYFKKVAGFIMDIKSLYEQVESNTLEQKNQKELKELNLHLYSDIKVENYNASYANPSYACSMLGKEYGRLLAFVYREIRGMIVYAYEERRLDITICNELFIEIYNWFETDEQPDIEELKKIVYWFVSDYSDITITYRVREQLDPSLDFATDIIMNSDLEDLRYLYRFGEYISDNEIKTAAFLNNLPQEEIDKIAATYTEGYRIGFINSKKDLSIKGTVNIRYNIGFERIVRSAIKKFAEMGLKPVIYRNAVNTINRRQNLVIGYSSTSPNKQYDYDHRLDSHLYLDRDFNERRLGVLKVAYDEYRELASQMAGPAVIEIFGEEPFTPVSKAECYRIDEKQQKLSVAYANASAKIINEYIRGDERSFTIIAFPIPEIGEDFEEIFAETVKINTLDQKEYGRVQQTLIDTLDKADYVRVVGTGKNKTNIVVNLHELKDSTKETKFENCLADINIPLGEVFTSPKLEGTNGLLNVSEVYLNELKYIDFEVTFKDGKIDRFTCKNFANEEENIKFIKENVMFNHETLPIGEFAIGTNTTAYVMANKYDIVYKLPILIVEKMGPHFAVGDTCFSWEEDNKTYNPDGKEIVAKDNEVSILRKKDTKKAYFNCHTDITIPYDEIGEITAVTPQGEELVIIENGRFVLKGTELLNKAFEENE